MNIQEIKEALGRIAEISATLEAAYMENGGEVTETTENYEQYKASLEALLADEGVDSLGRWLKSKEDERAAYKAEKAAADARIRSVERTIDFIKHEIGHILRVTKRDVVKGTFYSFKPLDAKKTSVNQELVNDRFYSLAEKAVRDAGLPLYIDFKLNATATGISAWAKDHEGEGSDLVNVASEETATFLKPRGAKNVE